MKIMLCIAIDVPLETTKRADQRIAAKQFLVQKARAGAQEWVRGVADEDIFLVRAYEQSTQERDKLARTAKREGAASAEAGGEAPLHLQTVREA